VRVFVVIKEKLYVTGSRHLYVIIVAALSAPLLITTVIVTLILVHRRRWVNWRKHSLANEALSAIHVHRQQSLTSQALQQSLQPDDERWEINPAMYVPYGTFFTNVVARGGLGRDRNLFAKYSVQWQVAGLLATKQILSFKKICQK